MICGDLGIVMTYRISAATGDFATATTWKDANSASVLDVMTANELVTTAYKATASFVPGAVTVDAIGVKAHSSTGDAERSKRYLKLFHMGPPRYAPR